MPGRSIKMLFLALAVAGVAVPATAENHQGHLEARVQYLRDISFSGPVRVSRPSRDGTSVTHVKGTATITLRRIEEVSVIGPLHLVPAPSGLADGASDVPPPVQWEGCITIKVGKTVDKGCDVVTPAVSLELDPAISEGAASFGVLSSKHEERTLLATLVIAGQGNPSPVPAVTPSVTPGPPSNNSATLDASVGLFRSFTVSSGSVRSEVIGGGAILSTRRGMAFQGVRVYADGNTKCPIFIQLNNTCPV